MPLRIEGHEQSLTLAVERLQAVRRVVDAEPLQRPNDVGRVVGVDVEDAELIAMTQSRGREPPSPFVFLREDPDEDDRPVDLIEQTRASTVTRQLGLPTHFTYASFVKAEPLCTAM